MADDVGAERPDKHWTVKLREVQRLTPTDPEEADDLFSVELDVAGPSMSGRLEVLVDVEDEGQVVAEALDLLQDGLEVWARVLGRRPGAEPVEPEA